MNKQHILSPIAILAFTLFSFAAKAQFVTPNVTGLPNKGKATLRQTAAGYYLASATADPDTVFYSKDMSLYRVIDTNGRTKVEGELTQGADGSRYVRNGKWTEFWGNGIPQSVTYYCLGEQTGPVITYYINGVMSSRYTLATVTTNTNYVLKTGLYQEFYENGEKKEEGFYHIYIDSNTTKMVTVMDPTTSKAKTITGRTIPVSEKTGKWFYYDAHGKRERTETY